MTFQKTDFYLEQDSKGVEDKKEHLNISGLCKFLLSTLIISLIVVGIKFLLQPTVYLVTGYSKGVVEVIQQGSEGVQSSQILSLIGMVLPLCFVAMFSTSILRNKKSRLTLSFVLPVAALSIFCFVMAIVQMAKGNGYQCVVYLIFELFAMFTLLVFNLIENRSKLNLKGVMKKAGVLGACLAIIALSFTSVFYKKQTVERETNEIEHIQKQD